MRQEFIINYCRYVLIVNVDSWSVPVVIGSRPEPCADITLVRTAQQQAVFCGQYVTMLIEFGTEALVCSIIFNILLILVTV